MDLTNFFNQDFILENERARVEPLEEKHFELLLPAAKEPSIWAFAISKVNSAEGFQKYFTDTLAERKNGISYTFAIYDKATGQYAGSTRFMSISFQHKRMELGGTWLLPPFHGSGLNKAFKFLLLNFAFETLQLNRLELKAHSMNKRSRNAMLKIGATEEGIFRNHIINDDGSLRDSVYFSFIIQEWPAIKNSIFREFV